MDGGRYLLCLLWWSNTANALHSKDKVFLDFNFEERDKVHAGVNSEFGEILWFYPSKSSTEIDSYVAYNYIEKGLVLWHSCKTSMA